MKKKFSIIIVPDQTGKMHKLTLSESFAKGMWYLALFFFGTIGYVTFDYYYLKSIESGYHGLVSENESLRTEARVLTSSLDEVKNSLKKVESYSNKLAEITKLKSDVMRQRTGLGPLSSSEYAFSQKLNAKTSPSKTELPTGLNIENLSFKPVFESLSEVKSQADQQASHLGFLLSSLSKHRSFLNSIPSFSPISGWVASNFGNRISPFTGERSTHRGMDLAASIGTPILAPADGIVIFSGAKEGFGNFLIIAHGYGVESRYGHNAQNLVQVGQKVSRGEPIATVGNSGRTTGPHLHYEIWVNSKAVNPKKFMLDQF